jgi:hypothetical protein
MGTGGIGPHEQLGAIICPKSVHPAEIVGLGLNRTELEQNPRLTDHSGSRPECGPGAALRKWLGSMLPSAACFCGIS